MIVVRLCKTGLVMAIALFFTFVSFGNITDYGSNWQFVQHVLSMDTTFPNSSLHWRAITDPTLQTAGYWLIIGAEVVTAALLWAGSFKMFRALSSSAFVTTQPLAVVGLSLGFLLYAVGFVVVGGEWFAMWQSQIWNGEQKAFDFIAMIGAVLIVVLQPDTSEGVTSRPPHGHRSAGTRALDRAMHPGSSVDLGRKHPDANEARASLQQLRSTT